MNTQNTALMERTPFLLPDMAADGGAGFTKEELAEDIDGLQLGFQRVKIPRRGHVDVDLASDNPANPDSAK